MFGFIKNKTKSNQSKEEANLPNKDAEVNVYKGKFEQLDKEFKDKEIKRKKEALPKDVLTKEELYREIEKYYNTKEFRDDNPFKTRQDVFITFFHSDNSIARGPIPFEEIEISNRPVLINKRFENGHIIIQELYAYPELEIDLEKEYANKHSTKRQLEKLNKYLQYIKDRINSGDEKYKLIDTDDILQEKVNLERKLESIRFGKSAIFHMQHPFNKKKTFLMRKQNGVYQWLKVTENNYIVDENNVRSIKGNKIIKDVEQVTNRRKNVNLQGIMMAIGAFIAIGILCFGLFKLVTFEEELFDKRVTEAVETRTQAYQEEIEYLRNQLNKRGIDYQRGDQQGDKNGDTPDFQEAR